MPNWVKNVLNISGDEKVKSSLMNKIKGEESIFDFNAVIPMPKALRIERSNILYNSTVVYGYSNFGIYADQFYKFIKNCIHSGESNKECIERLIKNKRLDMLLGKNGYENKLKYGYTDWYYWAVDNWGTKWNACEAFVNDNGNLEFDTAWAAPEPVISRLAAMYPELRFSHKWADEDCGSNTGSVEYEDGRVTYERHPQNCSPEAYKIYAYCWSVDLDIEEGEKEIWKSRKEASSVSRRSL